MMELPCEVCLKAESTKSDEGGMMMCDTCYDECFNKCEKCRKHRSQTVLYMASDGAFYCGDHGPTNTIGDLTDAEKNERYAAQRREHDKHYTIKTKGA